MKTRSEIGKILLWMGLIVLLIWALFPIYWAFTVSVKSGSQLFTWPPTYFPFPPTIDNFAEAIETRDVLPGFKNSLIVMAVSSPISVFFASLAAFGLARYRFRGKEIAKFGLLTIRMIPGMIIAIPIFLIVRKLGLQDTLLVIVIVYIAFNMPFNIWLLTGFFEEIPKEIEEAGLIDGCSPWQLFSKIVIPLSTPGLVASFIFCMLLAWNEFQFALILTFTVKSKTLPVVIAGMTYERGTFFGQMGAAGVMAMLPVLILGIYVQKYLLQGLTAGAVKG